MNSDLADTLGNLLQRVTAKKLHPDETSGAQLSLEMFRNTKIDDLDLVDRLLQLSGVLNMFFHLLHIVVIVHMYVCMYVCIYA